MRGGAAGCGRRAISSAAPMPCDGTKPSWRTAVASRAPATSTAPRRSSARRHASQSAERQQRVHAASGAVVAQRARVGGGRELGLGEQLRVAPDARRVEERAVRLLRRMREVAREPVDEDRRAAVGDRERVAPQTQREPEAEVGGEQRVRALARQVRRRARDPDHDRVERRVELGPPQLERAQQRLGVRDRRRPGERAGDASAPSAASAARCAAAPPGSAREEWRSGERAIRSQRVRVVRVAVQRARDLRMVEDERHADQRHAPRQRSLERERELPALRGRASRAASPRRPRAALSRPAAASSAAGPPCSTVSAAVTTTTRSVSTSAGLTRNGGAQSPRARRDPRPRRRARRRVRGSAARAPASRATRAPAATSAARARSRRGSSGTRSGCRAARARRRRRRSRAAADRRRRPESAATAARRRSSRASPRRASASSGAPSSGNRSASRTAARDVGDAVARRRRPQHERVVGSGRDDESRAGEKRDARHPRIEAAAPERYGFLRMLQRRRTGGFCARLHATDTSRPTARPGDRRCGDRAGRGGHDRRLRRRKLARPHHDRHRRRRHDAGTDRGGLRQPGGRSGRARVRPVRVLAVPRPAGRGRRSRRTCPGAHERRQDADRRAADAHHQPRSRRVGEPEEAVHAGLGRGAVEDAGLQPRLVHPRRPAGRVGERAGRRSRRARARPSPAPRSTSATAASTATGRAASAASRTRSRPTSRSRRSPAGASATTSRPTRRSPASSAAAA